MSTQSTTFGPKNELKAPKGKFRVIGVDTFEGPTEDYLIGDYDDEDKAREICQEHGGTMNPCYCYDDTGKLICNFGTP